MRQFLKQYKPNFTQRRNTMKKFMLVTLTMIMMLTLSAFNLPSVSAAPTPPVDARRLLIALLSGPAIDGVAPTAKAEFAADQGQTSLGVSASNLNLPDGRCLDVAFGRTVLTGIGVRGGSAFVSLSPTPEVIHRGELITISIGEPPAGQTQCGIIIVGEGLLAPATGTVILSGTFQ
jgi:hypothetical protein